MLNLRVVCVVVCSLAQQYVYPQAFLQPSLVLQSQLSPSVAALTSPYLDHSSAYSHYAAAAATAAGLEPYPYIPSTLSGGYLSYSFSPSGPAALTASPAPAAAPVHPPLATLAVGSGQQAFLHYPPLHQADRMQ